MLRFKVPPLITTGKLAEPEQWTAPELELMDEKWRNCRDEIDAPYGSNPKLYESMTINMEPSLRIKKFFVGKSRAQHMTNAGLKFIEIIARTGMLRAVDPNARHIDYFDNASAPGSFIFAANYWASTMLGVKLKWRASTLISKSDNSAFGDTYGLMEKFPQKFTTTGTPFNGDTTDTRYLKYMEKNYTASFDVYSSDLGMKIVHGDYNFQEAINARGNLGQVLMGLLVLRHGGTFLTKQYTHFSSFTMSLIAIVSASFDETYIIKPRTSKADNSEAYILGIGFKGTPPDLIEIMYAKLEDREWDMDREHYNFTTPMLAKDDMTLLITPLVKSARAMADAQCSKIRLNLSEYMKMKKTTRRVSGAFIGKHVAPHVNEWMSIAEWRKMSESDFIIKSNSKYSNVHRVRKGRATKHS